MKLCITSDLHGWLPPVPACDVFLVAGDVCPVTDHSTNIQEEFLCGSFSNWLDRVDAKHKVWIAGNHDFVCQQPGFFQIAEQIPGTYLIDDSYDANGLKIYGMPWVPKLRNWAFFAEPGLLAGKAADIPDDTDIALLHGPPAGILDRVGGVSVGSADVAYRLRQVRPRLCVFGHIHEAHGQFSRDGTRYVNAAYLDEFYEPSNEVVEVEL